MAYENDWSIKSKTPRYSKGKIKNWVGMTDEDASSFAGLFIWKHEGHVYYSRNSHHYELNQSTGEWESKTWVGLPSDTTSYPFNGSDVWHDHGETYWSYFTTINNYSSTRHICRHLNKNTGEWESSGIQGRHSYVGGGYVWTDGTNTYSSLTYTYRSSSSIEQPKVHLEFKYNAESDYWYWDTKTWNLSDSYEFAVGYNVWTDGNETYLTDSNSRTHTEYVLNKTTGNWDVKTWTRPWYARSDPAGRDVWSDGIYTYYSYRGEQYILDSGNSEWLFTELPASLQYGRYIWEHDGHIYYNYSGISLELEQEDYPVNEKVPYRTECTKCIESVDASDKWLSNEDTENQNDWVPVSFDDENSDGTITPSLFDGTEVLSDGINTYRTSSGSASGINFNKNRVFDKTTGTWRLKDWSSYRIGTTLGIWSDGHNIHYAYGNQSYDYTFDSITEKWFDDNVSLTIYGYRVWTDGENLYYSYGTNHYMIGVGSYETKTWGGLTNFDGQYVWNYKGKTYYSSGSSQYVLNKASSYWSPTQWRGLSSFDATYIWRDKENIYYSNGSEQYVLDQETNTWIKKTWTGLPYNTFYGNMVWSDGEDYYIGSAYKLNKNTKTPYRIDHPQTRETVPVPEVWIIGTDIPYRFDSAELIPSKNYSDLWLTKLDPDAPASDITFDPNYRYVKLEFDVNVTIDRSSSPYLRATTDLPHSNLLVSRGYYWYQWQIVVEPGTTVASRLYGVEESSLNLDEFMTMATLYSSNVETAMWNGVNLQMVPKKSQSQASGDLDITGKIYSSVLNTTAYNAQQSDEYYRSYYGCAVYIDTTATGSVSDTINVKLYYCFDSDEAGYDALLAAYPNHASPYSPEPATKVPFRDDFPELVESIPARWFIDDDIPFRVQFPELKESIPAADAWLIDDDIPFRIEYPPLIESIGAPESWLHDKGWEPRRPWPRHRNIVLEVQTIEDIPDVDWTKSMKQDFEFYTVDPNTWFDDKKLDNIISCNLTHDTTTDKRGNASITLSEPIDECYIRTYLVVTQNGRLYKFCLGTYLYMTSSDSFDGMKHNITMTGYTPLVELEEQYPKLGYHVVGYTNRKYGPEAPMVTDEIRDIILENTRCEVESRVMINKPLLNDFVPGQNDNWLTVVNNILNASSLQSYILTVDEWGTIIIADAPTIDDTATSFTYNDDNSSILLPTLDTFDDIYGIPNVMEVLYVGDKNLPAIRVVVKNEDEQSIVSIPRRGREIVRRYTINNIAAPLNDQTYAAVYAQVEAQAYKLLEAASTIQKTISYSHGYCDVKVGDMVLINYERAGMINVRAKVTSQRISCKPGCQVDETAVYTKKLWNRGV